MVYRKIRKHCLHRRQVLWDFKCFFRILKKKIVINFLWIYEIFLLIFLFFFFAYVCRKMCINNYYLKIMKIILIWLMKYQLISKINECADVMTLSIWRLNDWKPICEIRFKLFHSFHLFWCFWLKFDTCRRF